MLYDFSLHERIFVTPIFCIEKISLVDSEHGQNHYLGLRFTSRPDVDLSESAEEASQDPADISSRLSSQ